MKWLFVAGALLALAACASLPAHHLSTIEVESYKLEGVTASVAPDASVDWGIDEPAAKEQARTDATRRLQEHLFKYVGEKMQGTQPVRIEVVIHQVVVPSKTMRVVMGGLPVLEATATLKNATTGAELAVLRKHRVVAAGTSGVASILVDAMLSEDVYDKLIFNYGLDYRAWLLGK